METRFFKKRKTMVFLAQLKDAYHDYEKNYESLKRLDIEATVNPYMSEEERNSIYNAPFSYLTKIDDVQKNAPDDIAQKFIWVNTNGYDPLDWNIMSQIRKNLEVINDLENSKITIKPHW